MNIFIKYDEQINNYRKNVCRYFSRFLFYFILFYFINTEILDAKSISRCKINHLRSP